MEMVECVIPKLIFKRAEDTSMLSSFYCGYPPMDKFIHDKERGLEKYIRDGLTSLWVVATGVMSGIIGIFALSKSSIILNSFDYNVLNRQGIDLDMDIYDCKESYPALEIDYLAINEGYRGKGIGEHIIEKIHQRAIEDYFSATMFLTVDAISDSEYSAIGFYRKCGFIVSEYQLEHQYSANADTPSHTTRMYRYISRLSINC